MESLGLGVDLLCHPILRREMVPIYSSNKLSTPLWQSDALNFADQLQCEIVNTDTHQRYVRHRTKNLLSP